jgi:isopropylmalate/homocitrate/citramalate synthase
VLTRNEINIHTSGGRKRLSESCYIGLRDLGESYAIVIRQARSMEMVIRKLFTKKSKKKDSKNYQKKLKIFKKHQIQKK